MTRLRHPVATLLIGLVLGAVVGAGGLALVRSDTSDPVAATPPAASTYGPAGGVFDWFARADSTATLGATATGQPWQAVQGVWGIAGGSAYLVRVDPAKRAIAVVDTGASDGSVVAVERVTSSGSGIVFRYLNEFNYWAVRAAPQYGTWVIEKIVAGTATTVGNLGLTPTGNDTTLVVGFDGSTIDFTVDGVFRKVIMDGDLHTATQVGLTYVGPEPTIARWSLLIAPAKQHPVEVPTTTTPPATTETTHP